MVVNQMRNNKMDKENVDTGDRLICVSKGFWMCLQGRLVNSIKISVMVFWNCTRGKSSRC